MEEKLSTEVTPKSTGWNIAIAVVVLLVLLSLAFAVGFLMGEQKNPSPIIINTTAP